MKKNNISVIGIILGVGIVSLLGWLVMYSLNQSKPEKTNKSIGYEKYIENREKFNIEMTKNLEYKDYVLNNGDILVEINNKNDYPAYAHIYVELLDGDNKLVYIKTGIEEINSGQTGYNRIYIDDEVKELYETHKTKVILDYDNIVEKDYSKYIKDISYNDNTKTISFTNDSNKEIDYVEWGIIYYDKNEKIIDFSTEMTSHIKPNKKINERIYTGSKEYNKIKIVLLNAHNY